MIRRASDRSIGAGRAGATRRSDPRRGMVLVAVLWSISLLSALAMAASVTFRGFAGVMAVERDRLQADALLTAGLETAAGIIDGLRDTPLAEIETSVTLGTGAVRLRLNDEGGRIDIGRAPLDLIASMLRSVGAPQAAANDIARRIVERRKSGRPANTTTSAPAPPFSDLAQLASIPGMSPDWIAAIRPLATVFGGETVNPLTAPPGVIAALPGLDADRIDAFLKARRGAANADALVQMIAPAQRYLSVKSQRVASVDLDARLASGYASAARAVIVVLPQDSQPYRVLIWTAVKSSIVRPTTQG
jgi:general secretion pathway protein K